MALANIRSWIARGRFFPFSIYAMYVFYFLNDNAVYKFVSILTVAIDVLLFGTLIYKVTGSRKVKLASMLFMTIFIQVFTTYHNAVLSFHMFMQILFALLLLILINLHRYLQDYSMKHLVFALACLSIALLMYELAFVFLFVIIAFLYCYRRKFKDLFSLSALFAIPPLLVGILNIIVKISNTSGYDGIKPSFNIIPILATFTKQFFVAIPMSSYLVQNVSALIHPLRFLAGIQWTDAGISALFVIMFLFIMKFVPKGKVNDDFSNLRFGILGLVMWAAPAVPISISSKYQRELSWGIGHIPVFLEYFGLAVTCLWLIVYLKRTVIKPQIPLAFRRTMMTLLCLTLALVVLFNQQSMRQQIDQANLFWLYPKQVAVDAMESGILDCVGEDGTLVVLNGYPWNNSSFFTEFSKRVVFMQSASELIANRIAAGAQPIVTGNLRKLVVERAYLFDYRGDSTSGLSKFGRIDSIYSNIEGEYADQYFVDDASLFLPGVPSETLVLHYDYLDEESRFLRVDRPVKSLEVLSSSKNGVLLAIGESRPILFDSIQVDRIQPAALSSNLMIPGFGSGFFGEESNGQDTWRWGSSVGDLTLTNYGKSDLTVEITCTVSTFSESEFHLVFFGNFFSETFLVANKGTSIVRVLTLSPGITHLRYATDAPRIDSPGDARDLRIMFRKFRVTLIEDKS
jgi:hypothetical protein